MKTFIDTLMKNEKCRTEIISLYQRVQQNEMLSKDKFSNTIHLAKTVFIHSFSHLIIKELEFLCGYPSLQVFKHNSFSQDSIHSQFLSLNH
jgi:hypothetical protein